VPSVGRFIKICQSTSGTKDWPWDEDWWRKIADLVREWLDGRRDLDEFLDLLDELRKARRPKPPRPPIRRRLQRPVPLHDHGHPIHGHEEHELDRVKPQKSGVGAATKGRQEYDDPCFHISLAAISSWRN
jgi:hypothetical protein